MRPGPILLLLWLLAGLVPSPAAVAFADDPPSSVTVQAVAEIGPVIQDWPACVGMRDVASLPRLCKAPANDADLKTERFLSLQLYRKVGHIAALCEIDLAIVQAQHDCVNTGFSRASWAVASLMRDLAMNWEQRGTLERADVLYEKVYALYGRVGTTTTELIYSIDIVQRWATLKFRRGDIARARELAYVQAELGRWDFERGSAPRAHFVDALEFKADLLEKLGKNDEAFAARKEAAAMSGIYTICPGLCDGDYAGTYGGVREKR